MKILKIILVIVVVILTAFGFAYYLYNKPVADTSDLETNYKLKADELFMKFENNEADANKLYLGKIIEVKGKVREMSIGDSGELNMVLAAGSEMFGINCGLLKNQNGSYQKYKVGDSIVVKGECAGISMDVVMTRCVIVK